ncbi:rhodanese-like domain-containing protein [Treponema sp. OMZ 787]|uniref:rhodanese-like domain-containing protein n=1 Tax=Treponema sp. OMZ 787 TaxID=2563669 RepID=UPI0020A59182|nr:rhodanese-like domain-containing protein [Treponema sp. OMZ 787]UTC62164.1 rhodanese-like domain-containing protein [Treponema sp. OMZ 787]
MKIKFFLFIVLIINLSLISCGIEVEVEDVKGSRLEYLNSDSNKDSILVIDVRTYDQYKKGHIVHSINIPVHEIKYRLKEIEDWKNKPIYIYSETNDESFKAAQILVENRFTQIYNADGINQYNYSTINYTSVRGVVFEKMLKDPDVLILDCRNKSSYDVGHIEGALLFPMAEIESNLNKIPDKNKKLLLYCNLGTASSRTAQELSELGYSEIYNSIDGVSEYPFKLVK